MLWRKLALSPIALTVIVATSGWFYLVRATGLPGPRMAEALPLDELARHSSVPLLWFVSVWVAGGLLLGAVARWAGLQRAVAALVLAVATGLLLYVTVGVSLAITRQVPARVAFRVTERLQVIYLPAVLVGLSVALIGRPRAAGRRSPAIVAMLVATAATLELLHTGCPGAAAAPAALTPDAVGPSPARPAPSPGSPSFSPRGASRAGATAPGSSRSRSRRSRRACTCCTGSTRERSSRPSYSSSSSPGARTSTFPATCRRAG